MTQNTQHTQFLLAWQKTLNTVRETLAAQFNKPNFKLDFHSKDSKYALAIILEHDMVDEAFDGGQKDQMIAAYSTMEDLNGKSHLDEIGQNYSSIVNIAAQSLKHEIRAMNSKMAGNTKPARDVDVVLEVA